MSEPLVRVTLVLCADCLAGIGGECHVPGCALWMSRAPDVPIADKCESFTPLAAASSGDTPEVLELTPATMAALRRIGKRLDCSVAAALEEVVREFNPSSGDTETGR